MVTWRIITCSPLDPVFWFHHCFVDYLWEKCRQIQTTDKQTDYPRDSAVPAAHKFNATMKPFLDKICIDGLSNSYIPGYYSYLPSPSNCTTHAQCGGKALWCNSGKCTASVRAGGTMGTRLAQRTPAAFLVAPLQKTTTKFANVFHRPGTISFIRTTLRTFRFTLNFIYDMGYIITGLSLVFASSVD